MIYLLKIGYQTFALKDDKGFSTIMRVMAQASLVKSDTRYRRDENGTIELDDKPVDVQMEVVQNFHFTKRHPIKSTFVEPEIIPPNDLRNGPGSRKQVAGEVRRLLAEGRFEDAGRLL